MNNQPTIEELSIAMEKMYQEHNAQIVTMSRMITTLAKLAGYDPVTFAQHYCDQESSVNYAHLFNQAIDNLEKK